MNRFFCLILLVSTALLVRCSSHSEEDFVDDTNVYPDHESWHSSIVLTKAGKKRAVVNSGHLKKFSAKSLVEMNEGVLVDFFDEYGDSTSQLTSDSATVIENTNDLTAIGNVVVVSDSSGTLYTEKLRWNSEKEQILTDEFVTFITEQDTLTGYGFEADGGLEYWTIFKPSGVTDREFKK